MQRTERRLDAAALFRNSKHLPNRVTIISEAHSFEYGTACRDHGLNARGFTGAVSTDGAESPMKSKTVFIGARRFESRSPLRS